jgi:hypothetical protein
MAIASFTGALVAQVWFLRNGLAFTSPSSGTVSATAKPDGADSIWDTWFMPNCEEFTVETTGEEVKIMGGQQGGLVLKDHLQLSQETKITFKGNELSALAVQALFGTDVLTAASTQGNPTEGKRLIKGWLRCQAYDGDHVNRLTGVLYGSLKVVSADPWSGKNVARCAFEFNLIRAAGNTLGM